MIMKVPNAIILTILCDNDVIVVVYQIVTVITMMMTILMTIIMIKVIIYHLFTD